MNGTRRYGWIPSYGDPNNHPTLEPEVPILPEVNGADYLFPVYNQFQIGSCTGNATAAVFRNAFIQSGCDPGDFSRLWIYLRERIWEGTPPTDDSGAMGHTAYKVARKIGLALESDWPYGDGSDFAGPAPEGAGFDAQNYRIKTYSHPSQKQDTFQKLLSNKQLISFGFSVGSHFESEEVTRSGVYIPQPGDRIIGGHEVVLVGYVEAARYGVGNLPEGTMWPQFRNSWGGEWGANGYFIAPWSFVLDSRISSDFRTVDPL